MQRIIGAAAAAVMLAGAAGAQEQGPGEADVRAFVDAMAESARQAIAAGDWQAIEGWLQEHVAEDAQFAMTGAVNMRGGPVVSYEATFDADDVARFARMGVMGTRALEDYGLEAEVRHVETLSNGEAGAIVVFHEVGTIDPSRLPGGGEAQAGAAPPATIDSTSTCDMRLSGTGADLRIVLASCTTSTLI